VSTRWAGVGVLSLMGCWAGAAETDGVSVEDRRGPVDIAGVLAPRGLVAEPPAPGPLVARLVWLDPVRTAVGVQAVARDEVRSLLRKMGVSATWRTGEAGETARPGEVRVILLGRAAANASGAPILGATPPRFDGPPFVWIHVPNVRAVIGLRPDGPPAPLDRASVRALGLALGRVVAHELVHVLSPSTPHGKGLMSEKLTRCQLTAARLEVEPAVAVAVRACLRGEPTALPAGTDVLAATTSGRERDR
jgi:hypothetical protein